jgi:hypothetical protein
MDEVQDFDSLTMSGSRSSSFFQLGLTPVMFIDFVRHQ